MMWMVIDRGGIGDVHDEGHINGDGGVGGGLHVDKISGLHIEKRSCWWSSMLQETKILFWIVNITSTLILLSTVIAIQR